MDKEQKENIQNDNLDKEENNQSSKPQDQTDDHNKKEEDDKKELTPELPDLKKFKSTDGVLTPPTE